MATTATDRPGGPPDMREALYVALMRAERLRDRRPGKVSLSKYAHPWQGGVESDQDYISTTPVGGA